MAPSDKPKKSPKQKRAEKEKQRKEWSDTEVAEAFAAAGGTPKEPEAKPKHPGGRPPLFPTLDLDLLRRLYEAGNTDAQAAQIMGIGLSTLTVWKSQNPEFLASIKGWKAHADEAVERSLWERATGYSHPEDKIFYDNQAGRVVVQPTVKHYPPDTAAAFIWLKNRKSAEWKDKAEAPPDTSVTVTFIDGAPDAV